MPLLRDDVISLSYAMQCHRRRRSRCPCDRGYGDDIHRRVLPMMSSSSSPSSPFVLALLLAYAQTCGGNSSYYEDGHPCKARLWHPDVVADSPTCTNTNGDGDYPSYWNDPAMKGVTMFDTPQECCKKLEQEALNRDCIIQEASDCVVEHDDVPCEEKRRWHASKSHRETCINDDNYPSPWNDEYFLGKTMFESQNECCDSLRAVGATNCNVINVCDDPNYKDTLSPKPKPPPIYSTGGSSSKGPASGSSSISGSSYSSSCTYPWHPSIPEFNGCSNSPRGTYPNDWNHPDVHHHYLYGTHEDCCNGFFDFDSIVDCHREDVCREEGPTPSPILPSKYCEDESSGLKWHKGAKMNECTNDLDYPFAWEDPAVIANHLFDTPEECCVKHSSAGSCNVVDVCGSMSTTIEANNVPITSPTITSTGGTGTSDQGNDNNSNSCNMRRKDCINDPKCAWDRTTRSCVSIASTLSGAEQYANCNTKKYHPMSASERKCINNDIFPSLWSDREEDYFFATGEECCEVFYSDGSCDIVNVCSNELSTGSSNAQSSTVTMTTKEPDCRKWHPISESDRTCTNSGRYPASWDDSPDKYFFTSGRRCCNGFYGGGDCEWINVC